MKTLFLMVLSFIVGFVVASVYSVNKATMMSQESIDSFFSQYSQALTESLSGWVSSGAATLSAGAKREIEELKNKLKEQLDEKKEELKEQARRWILESFTSRINNLFN